MMIADAHPINATEAAALAIDQCRRLQPIQAAFRHASCGDATLPILSRLLSIGSESAAFFVPTSAPTATATEMERAEEAFHRRRVQSPQTHFAIA